MINKPNNLDDFMESVEILLAKNVQDKMGFTFIIFFQLTA